MNEMALFARALSIRAYMAIWPHSRWRIIVCRVYGCSQALEASTSDYTLLLQQCSWVSGVFKAWVATLHSLNALLMYSNHDQLPTNMYLGDNKNYPNVVVIDKARFTIWNSLGPYVGPTS